MSGTEIGAAVLKGAAEKTGEAVAKRLLARYWNSIDLEIKSRRHPDLKRLKQICVFFASFTPRGTETLYPSLPDDGQWKQHDTSMKTIFDEWFGRRPDQSVANVLRTYKNYTGSIHEVFGAYNVVEFRDSSNRLTHRTIRKMYPFILLYAAKKPINERQTVGSMTQSFKEGWSVFVDGTTRFEEGIAVILENQAYIDGTFLFDKIVYKLDGVVRAEPLYLKRAMIVSDVGDTIHICMTGIPGIRGANIRNGSFVERWLREFQLPRTS